MHRRTLITAAGTGIAAATAGCLGSADDRSARSAADEATIEVAATGRAEADPDMAVVRVAVEADGSDADTVRETLAADAAAVHEALLDLGIADDRITTDRYDIRERRQGRGYEGTHAYRVEVTDVDRVGEVIDAAVAAGADDVGRATFTLSEPTREDLREAALEDAMENAEREAETIVASLDARLVGVRSVSTADVGVRPVHSQGAVMEEAADAGGPATDLESGPVTVTARVEVVYAVE